VLAVVMSKAVCRVGFLGFHMLLAVKIHQVVLELFGFRIALLVLCELHVTPFSVLGVRITQWISEL
jgi:hypothetical protein